jgi:CheY-like chemotaxis protein
VFLADDQPRLRELLADQLRGAGYDVTEASDGTDLVAKVRANAASPERPIAIVTDVRMPGLSGLEALEVLGPLARVPTVVMTASATPAIRARAAQLSAVVLEKPDVLEELVDTVRTLVGDAGEH